MNRKITLLLAVLVVMLASVPAFAYNASASCRGHVRWNNNDVLWKPSLISFPQGSGWYNSIDAVRVAWNSFTPGGNYRINYLWDTANSFALNDNKNSIFTPATWPEDPNYLAVTYPRRSMCYAWPGPDANWVEMDIIFNNNQPFETSLNPVGPRYAPYNAALTALHEHGHGMGLAHENDFPATMNATYPFGGTIANQNFVHPHADDARGDRAVYGTAATQRDVAAYAYRLVTPENPQYPGSTDPIQPQQSSTARNAPISFQFSVENRGTTDQSSIPVYFYLTPTRGGVTTSSFYLGSATLSIDAGRTVTGNAYVTVPSYAPTGYQYIGWIVDPGNGIVESDEINNAVTMFTPIYVGTNSAPTACFTASPSMGSAPLNVAFNASCSYDPDGSIVSYSWDFGDGDTGTGQYVNHWYYDPGFYDVTLTVTDAYGAVSYDYGSIYVSGGGGSCGSAIICDPEEPL
jgi:hypothetical protein